ncbi:MAG: monofunctional biosynthetic peptidoglycan transglycosylase, partial [Pseudomonadota bacterium]
MATRKAKSKSRTTAVDRILSPFFWVRGWLARVLLVGLLVFTATVFVHSLKPPAETLYMKQEAARLGEIDYRWVSIEDVSPVMARSVVAAEDANFCLHWG